MDIDGETVESPERISLTEAAKLLQRLKLCKAFNDRGGINGPNCQRFGRQDLLTKRWSWDIATLIQEARRRKTVSEEEILSILS